MPKKRHQISIHKKLRLIGKVKDGRSIRSVARENLVAESNIRNWITQEDELKSLVFDRNIQTKFRKRLVGGGRNAQFDEIEKMLMNYVNEKNEKGICVKRRYLIANALKFRNHLVQQIDENLNELDDNTGEEAIKLQDLKRDLMSFKASLSWVTCFKIETT
jgi:hypothetical protein